MLRFVTSSVAIWLIMLAGGFAATARQTSPQDKSAECLACHSDINLVKDVDGKQVSLHVDEQKFKASIHGNMFGCTDCHTDVKAVPHEPAPKRVRCETCHEDEVRKFGQSLHASAILKGNTQAASCLDCHGGPHEILPASDPKSKVSHANIPATCGACHGQKFVMASSGISAQPFYLYEESVHGKNVAAGSVAAAVCTDCHGAHDIKTAADPQSPIFKFNVPNTCAKCHEKVKQEFVGSIHGQALARGNWQAPVCTDCHGIHSIKAPTDPTSSVSAQALARTTCARCHESVRLASEFGVESRRASTYMASYHGLASRLGSNVVANCASCHGVHNILASTDPKSTINPANLVKTCGQCHPGVNQNFTRSKIHVNAPLSADIGSIAVRWVRRFYLAMIFAVIGAMLLHNVIIWRRKAVERRNAQRRIVVRMQKEQRIQHLVLLTSFIVLVITGFALKYPDSWLASALMMSERVRSIVHRVAGSALIAAGLYHIFYVIARRQGRRLLKDMLPVPKDAFDVIGVMRYYLGFGDKKPEFARFNYAEKAEYWALLWGTIVMAVTGLMLWFKVMSGDLVPRWWLDVATAVHFYEAVLATLAIVVWHFYMVFFDPDVYPMNWAWYDGRMSAEHYSEEHALDGETLRQAVEAAAQEVTTSETLTKAAAQSHASTHHNRVDTFSTRR